MPFRTLKEVTVTDVNGEQCLHLAGVVLSDWEVSDFVKNKIHEGSLHYRALYEVLTDDEARAEREHMTALEGDRLVNGHAVSPPWPDYVGLHPTEVLNRMYDCPDRALLARVREYESVNPTGARQPIMDYVAPAERPPFHGYDDMAVNEVLAKLDVLPMTVVAEALTYEMAHRRRPAIITYEREPEAAPEENAADEVALAGAAA